ncbi:MAG TPA: cytochrome c maturation protein CcmE [Thermoanaerobaculia bacterium]|nr:cytochrome c maturation protein CcmE [Thermoanaerobaculia bacterium]
MSKRTTYILGALLLCLFAAFAYASFRATVYQYVPFEKAVASGRTVQVAGGLEKGTSSYDDKEQALRFVIKEESSGKTMTVRYHGVKPGNFEDAVSIVAVGRYEPARTEFAAEKLLVKCPSKYQGAEVEEKVYD